MFPWHGRPDSFVFAPDISVIIPTRGRPGLLVGAVASALEQSYSTIEVIVVVDGPDPDTTAAIARFADRRLRLLQLPENRGGSEARNAGVLHARGEWIAFLDDDDEWRADKLEKQMSAATASSYSQPVIGSAVLARTAHGDSVWPRRLPFRPLSEYLFSRTTWFQGEALVQTSTLLAPRSLLLAVPFRAGLKRHQDWDWLLRACEQPGVGLEFVPEALAMWRVQDRRSTVSSTADWQSSLHWARENRSLLTSRAFAGFIATQVAPQAAQQRAWRTFFPLLREAAVAGQLRLNDLLLYLGMWFIPPQVRQSLRGLL